MLRAERNALKEGCPSEAKKWNYRMKVPEKDRLVPDSKRKPEAAQTINLLRLLQLIPNYH